MEARTGSGGGVLLDLASHHLDLLRWFLQDEVATVAASLGSQITEQDTAQLALTMRSGVEVQSFFSFRSGLADYLEFIGERGTLRVDRHAPVLTLDSRGASATASGVRGSRRRRPSCHGGSAARSAPRTIPRTGGRSGRLSISCSGVPRPGPRFWTASAASRPC